MSTKRTAAVMGKRIVACGEWVYVLRLNTVDDATGEQEQVHIQNDTLQEAIEAVALVFDHYTLIGCEEALAVIVGEQAVATIVRKEVLA